MNGVPFHLLCTNWLNLGYPVRGFCLESCFVTGPVLRPNFMPLLHISFIFCFKLLFIYKHTYIDVCYEQRVHCVQSSSSTTSTLSTTFFIAPRIHWVKPSLLHHAYIVYNLLYCTTHTFSKTFFNAPRIHWVQPSSMHHAYIEYNLFQVPCIHWVQTTSV